jgi:hypothetical protein
MAGAKLRRAYLGLTLAAGMGVCLIWGGSALAASNPKAAPAGALFFDPFKPARGLGVTGSDLTGPATAPSTAPTTGPALRPPVRDPFRPPTRSPYVPRTPPLS